MIRVNGKNATADCNLLTKKNFVDVMFDYVQKRLSFKLPPKAKTDLAELVEGLEPVEALKAMHKVGMIVLG